MLFMRFTTSPDVEIAIDDPNDCRTWKISEGRGDLKQIIMDEYAANVPDTTKRNSLIQRTRLNQL